MPPLNVRTLTPRAAQLTELYNGDTELRNAGDEQAAADQ